MGITLENIGQPFAPLLDNMKQDPRLARLKEPSLKRLGVNMLIYTLGLIVLINNNPPYNAEELVLGYLRQMGEALIKQEYERNKEI